MSPFSAKPGGTVNIDVSSSAQYVQITTMRAVRQIRVMNNGTATAWVRFANVTGIVPSVTADLPVGPGVTEVFTVAITDGPIWAGVIAAGSTGKIYFTPGQGI